MSNVIKFPGTDETPDELFARMTGTMRDVVVIGISNEGALEYEAAGGLDFDQVLGRIEMAKAIWIAHLVGITE